MNDIDRDQFSKEAIIARRGWIQHALCAIYAHVYRKWLWDEFTKTHDTVLKVRGWRTALVETKYGARKTMTACFWRFQ